MSAASELHRKSFAAADVEVPYPFNVILWVMFRAGTLDISWTKTFETFCPPGRFHNNFSRQIFGIKIKKNNVTPAYGLFNFILQHLVLHFPLSRRGQWSSGRFPPWLLENVRIRKRILSWEGECLSSTDREFFSRYWQSNRSRTPWWTFSCWSEFTESVPLLVIFVWNGFWTVQQQRRRT